MQKDARGYITPSEFNRFLAHAQEETFNDVYTLYSRAMQKRLAQLEYKDLKYHGISQIQDDLLPCFRTASLSQISTNTFSYPSDYKYIEGIDYGNVTCELYRTGDDFNYVRNSRVTPTTTYPAAVLSYNTVTMYPTTITSAVTMSYYKKPQGVNASGTPVATQPTWAYDTIGGQAVYNATNSIQPELPESTYNHIIARILQLAGMSIREAEVVEFANREEVKNAQQA